MSILFDDFDPRPGGFSVFAVRIKATRCLEGGCRTLRLIKVHQVLASAAKH
jgi:hypothetical protein